MNLLTLEHITKSYTERILLNDASFYVLEGEKIGVIGTNGCGKSTLLKIIAGLEEADAGSVVKANHVIIRYLAQNPQFKETDTVLESVCGPNRTKENEWSIESDAKAMLTKLGITSFDANVSILSGGQKKRLALVGALLSEADILILDEPTNHLDHKMTDWLEEELIKWRGTLIMVTHDRYFLDSVSNRIVEIEKGNIYSYSGNYSMYLELKEQREEMELATERKRQSILRKDREWMMRGARARSTKQKAHIQRYEDLLNQEGIKIDAKLEMGSVSSRMGKMTIELKDVSFSYDEKEIIKKFSYIFLKQDRVGFIGANGCGKTTLMKLIGQKLLPTDGEILVGQTIKIGYYTQEILDKKEHKQLGLEYMDPSMRVIDYIKNTAEFVKTDEGSISASKMLERFLFPAAEQYNKIEKLSGGEKRRLHLLRILMEAPNVLILDEPTNDLDINTLSILEDYLDSFDGIVIMVSHDRYFLDRCVRRIFAFEEVGNIIQYEGGYTEYSIKRDAIEEQEEQRTPQKEVKKETEKGKWNTNRKLKFSYKEEREYETIDQDIHAIESRLEEIEQLSIVHARDFVELAKLQTEKEELELSLEIKMERWIYLEDLATRIKEENEAM
ncbi:MAG: ABC-F family ATP-binding cassette domain-containing protein [Lachnospiraceae bacterium]